MSRQELDALRRENALLTTAWYDLASRLQSNTLLLQRRSEAPKSWLGRQRASVSGPTSAVSHLCLSLSFSSPCFHIQNPNKSFVVLFPSFQCDTCICFGLLTTSVLEAVIRSDSREEPPLLMMDGRGDGRICGSSVFICIGCIPGMCLRSRYPQHLARRCFSWMVGERERERIDCDVSPWDHPRHVHRRRAQPSSSLDRLLQGNAVMSASHMGAKSSRVGLHLIVYRQLIATTCAWEN